MAPILQINAEHADADDDDDGEESYIEEEIIEEEDEEETLEEEEEEEVVEEEIIEEEDDDDDDETIEEEIVEDDDEDDEGSISLGDDSSSAPDARRDKKANKSEARSKLLQEIANQRKLAENLKRQNSEVDTKRKQALSELRRQAARDELARSNSKLKAGRVARSIASASTASSIVDKKAPTMERVQSSSAGVERINTVAIPQRQAPVSPLKSREDPSPSTTKSSSQVANIKSKLKPAPFGHTSKQSTSRVTEWIREDPMENESNKDALQSEENVRTGVMSEKSKGKRSSVSQLKKQLSLGSQPSFGQAGSESGSVPLKSRSNDMSISSSSIKNEAPNLDLNNKVDNYYSLAQLQEKSVDGIDGARREKYLSPKDFKAHFNMTKEEFYKLPRWKQSEAKKALNLF